MIPAEAVSATLKELEGCEIYSIEKEDNRYRISIDTEDHTFLLKVSGSGDVEAWDRFLSKDEVWKKQIKIKNYYRENMSIKVLTCFLFFCNICS